VLDAFGGLDNLAERWHAAKSTYETARAELDGFDARTRERAERLDLLRFQASELEAARVTPEQHAELLAERDRLRWAEDLSRDLGALARGFGGEDGGALDDLRRARRVLEAWVTRVPELSEVHADAESALAAAEDASAKLERFLAKVEADPARLEAIDDRLYRLETLAKKHRTDAAGLLARAESIGAELAQLESQDESAEALGARVAEARAAAVQLAKDLARKRVAAATKLAAAVHASLGELGLPHARFGWETTADGARDEARGAARVARDAASVEPPSAEFFLAANPGEPARSLRHVASGGEAARILLAVRVALALQAAIPTLVFDEIDAGVGGRLGPQVGAHLKRLAQGHQVLCVTHLPAIAALADRHYRVSKAVKKGRTTTEVALLQPDARVDEVADMIAGGAAHATARAEARRLLGA
jgi:DNA repair protein RecN (Recombination protein N)